MIIIEMILKITGWSQEELANFLGISRVSVNCWLHGNDISLSSKKLISDKFKFPIGFFDISLDENIEYYRVIYSVIYKNVMDMRSDKESFSQKDKIQDILNRLEINDKTIYEKEITDEDIIDGLINGYNPFTGEVLDENHLLNNPRVKKVLSHIKLTNKINNEDLVYDDLTAKEQRLFNKLRKWRLDQMYKEGHTVAYLILNDKALINIVRANIKDKKDLLHVKGIGTSKYEKYADDIYSIIKDNE